MSYDQKELQMGTAIEHEHTQDDKLAQKIAMDHLREDPHYYTKLNAAGLEQEGAMTPTEAGLENECDASGIPIGGEEVKVAIVAPTEKNGETAKLSSSGLGKSGVPKPLKSDDLKAPESKIVNNKNTVGSGKTPPLSGPSSVTTNSEADPAEFFGTQMANLPQIQVPMFEGGAQLKKK